MPRFAITDAPSILGLKPTGVEGLPEALKAAGLQTGLNAECAGRVEPASLRAMVFVRRGALTTIRYSR